jgi:hypothetical protein
VLCGATAARAVEPSTAACTARRTCDCVCACVRERGSVGAWWVNVRACVLPCVSVCECECERACASVHVRACMPAREYVCGWPHRRRRVCCVSSACAAEAGKHKQKTRNTNTNRPAQAAAQKRGEPISSLLEEHGAGKGSPFRSDYSYMGRGSPFRSYYSNMSRGAHFCPSNHSKARRTARARLRRRISRARTGNYGLALLRRSVIPSNIILMGTSVIAAHVVLCWNTTRRAPRLARMAGAALHARSAGSACTQHPTEIQTRATG